MKLALVQTILASKNHSSKQMNYFKRYSQLSSEQKGEVAGCVTIFLIMLIVNLIVIYAMGEGFKAITVEEALSPQMMIHIIGFVIGLLIANLILLWLPVKKFRKLLRGDEFQA